MARTLKVWRCLKCGERRYYEEETPTRECSYCGAVEWAPDHRIQKTLIDSDKLVPFIDEIKALKEYVKMLEKELKDRTVREPNLKSVFMVTLQTSYEDSETYATCRTLESALEKANEAMAKEIYPMHSLPIEAWQFMEGERAYYRSTREDLNRSVSITEYELSE